MGEQGLASAQSLKAAENQAAQLTNIYTGFSKAASARITEDFSKALSDVAVKTGGTVSDIQKSLATAPFLSRDLSFGQRGAILGDIQRIQTFASQAGLGNNAADIFKKIATGQTNAMELEESDDALSKVIGAQLRNISGGTDLGSISIKDRTRILQDVIKNLNVNELEELAKESGGFRVVLAKFSASLFNPKVGLFGAMREFTLKTGEAPTTLFKETTKLFESIFGESGFIKTLGRELAKAFGVRGEDAAVKFLGRGIRFITNLIKNVTDLIDDVLNNPLVKGIIGIVKSAFDGIVGFIRNLDDIAKNPPQFPSINKEVIQNFIVNVGGSISSFIRRIGEDFRNLDTKEQTDTIAEVLGTYAGQVGKILGTAVSEGLKILFSQKGLDILAGVFEVIRKGLTGFFTEILGNGIGGGILGFLGATGVIAAFGKTVFMGVMGFAASLIAALPGGNTLMKMFGDAVQNRLGGRGGRNRVTSGREERRGRRGRGRRGRGGGGGGGGAGPDIPPDLDDLISSVRNQPDRYSLDPMFQNIRETNELNRFNREFAQSQQQFRDREFFQRQFVKGQYSTSLGGFQMEGPLQIGKYGSQYRTPIGPLPHGSAEPWTMADGQYRPYMGSVNEEAMLESRRQEIARRQALGNRNPFTRFGRDVIDTAASEAVPGYIDRGRLSAAARFNRRYGFGGTRAVMGRGIGKFGARIGGMGRGIGSYYRGGGGSGVTGLIGGGIMLGGSMLGESIGGETGENVMALSQIGGGALSGASTGAMIGSIIPGIGTAAGAIIGAVIGGAAPLMDKGVRDAVGRFIGDIGKSLSDGAKIISNAISGGINSIQSGWNFAIKTAQDWVMNLLPESIKNTISYFTQELPKKMKDFAVGLGTSMLDSVKNFNLGKAVLDTWENIKRSFTGREVGGPVIKGTSYIVGERGPEIFTPGESGTVLTNRELNTLSSRASGNGGSQNIVFNVTINATGLAGNDIAAAIQPAVIKILDDGMKKASGNMITRGATVI